MELDKKYYKEQLQEARLEKIVYMQALKNYGHCFEDENQNDMIEFCATKLAKIISNIEYLEYEIKKIENENKENE